MEGRWGRPWALFFEIINPITMSKTKELAIMCSGEIRTVANRNKLTVHIEEPDVEDALTSFNSDDLIQYISNNYGVEEVYSEKDLQKWAEENGYVKEE